MHHVLNPEKGVSRIAFVLFGWPHFLIVYGLILGT